MSIFKCKMCGGALEIQNNETVIECTYCGTMQTLPKLDDDRKANLYDRANHFRRNNEFDKAMGIYEQILNEDQTDAETYWSLVLCRYGIEYVEDPASHKRIPTVNRAQFTSILADEDYKSALQYADSYQRNLYEQEAKAIDEIQKGILAISQQEEPFDVFICYKETDAAGRRTPDSVLANDLYHQLTQEGFRVFFSRITLEDKLGSAYEPYIFAALNSAKAMVVLGTKPEYFNAVWVKNEWSRYLSLIKKGDKKTLIPAYKDMDPYDLPEEFSHLQAQDMSKLGFMQDLIRGIKKIVQTEAPKTTVVKETVVTGGNVSIAPLLKRAFMFLEDGEWASADEYCEKVLDMDPECAEAYLGKLMAELRVRKQDSLKDCAEPFDNRNNYQKALRFSDKKLKDELTACTEYIKKRNEQTRLEDIYSRAQKAMEEAKSEADYKEVARTYESISEYKDSAALVKECREKAEVARKDAILFDAKNTMLLNSITAYEEAIQIFKSISGWKDADEQITVCYQKIDELKAKREAKRLEDERRAKLAAERAKRVAKRNKRIAIIGLIFSLIVIAGVTAHHFVAVVPKQAYQQAVMALENQQFDEVTSYVANLKSDKYGQLIENKYLELAEMALEEGRISDYNNYVTRINNEQHILQLQNKCTNKVIDALSCDDISTILRLLKYSDFESLDIISYSIEKIKSGYLMDIVSILNYIQMNMGKDVWEDTAVQNAIYETAKNYLENGQNDKYEVYKDRMNRVGKTSMVEQLDMICYEYALSYYNNGEYNIAVNLFQTIGYKAVGYNDAKDYIRRIEIINLLDSDEIKMLDFVKIKDYLNVLPQHYKAVILNMQSSLDKCQGAYTYYSGRQRYLYITGIKGYWGDDTGCIERELIFDTQNGEWECFYEPISGLSKIPFNNLPVEFQKDYKNLTK